MTERGAGRRDAPGSSAGQRDTPGSSAGQRETPSPSAGPRARLFVALELSEKVRDELATWGRAALGGRGAVRFLAPDNLHVTLCFLGWQLEDAIEPIAEACRGVAGMRAGRLALDEAIWLPPKRPRVLAVRLAEDEQGLVVQLQSRLSELLEAGGWYVPERRAYLPHVTVARVRGRAAIRPDTLSAPPPLSFPASQVTLFRSHLSASGARYEPLASMNLD